MGILPANEPIVAQTQTTADAAASADDVIELSQDQDVPAVDDVQFTEQAESKAKHSKAYAAYLERYAHMLLKQNAEAVDEFPTFIQFIDSQIHLFMEGESIENLAIREFSNTPLIPAYGPSFFPRELYPAKAVSIGVGSKEKRYLQQLEKMYHHPQEVQRLAFVAMRRFFYEGMRFNVLRLKDRRLEQSLDFVRILNVFIDDHLVQLLHVADQFFGPEIAGIELQQKEIAKHAVETAGSKQAELMARVNEVAKTEEVLEPDFQS